MSQTRYLSDGERIAAKNFAFHNPDVTCGHTKDGRQCKTKAGQAQFVNTQRAGFVCTFCVRENPDLYPEAELLAREQVGN